MKKIFIILLALLLLCGCTNTAVREETSVQPATTEDTANKETVRSVWMTYYELHSMIKNCNEQQFRTNIDAAFDEIAKIGFNTVTVHVRPYGDAFYRSAYFPSSAYCFDKQGADMPYDPLQVMCEAADKHHLHIEAWINPYRVSAENDMEKLCDENQAKIWYADEETKSNVYCYEKGIYYNPASEAVRLLIVSGVKELVENYALDAIHFDDYFYPTTDEAIDAAEFAAYQKDGGELSLADWRRENVNMLLQEVYYTVHQAEGNIRFGISPAANMENDYSKLYADVTKWMKNEGYADYICPQVYFGFKNVYQPFMFTVKKWMYLCQQDLYIGLPLYKAGKPDQYAAKENEAIINEFADNDNIIARQITYLSKLEQVKGFYVFSYSCLSDETCRKEAENMIKTMQDIYRN